MAGTQKYLLKEFLRGQSRQSLNIYSRRVWVKLKIMSSWDGGYPDLCLSSPPSFGEMSLKETALASGYLDPEDISISVPTVRQSSFFTAWFVKERQKWAEKVPVSIGVVC